MMINGPIICHLVTVDPLKVAVVSAALDIRAEAAVPKYWSVRGRVGGQLTNQRPVFRSRDMTGTNQSSPWIPVKAVGVARVMDPSPVCVQGHHGVHCKRKETKLDLQSLGSSPDRSVSYIGALLEQEHWLLKYSWVFILSDRIVLFNDRRQTEKKHTLSAVLSGFTDLHWHLGRGIFLNTARPLALDS